MWQMCVVACMQRGIHDCLQGGLALYEVLLGPPLTLHQQHNVKDMTKPSNKVTSPMLLMAGHLSATRLMTTVTAKCKKYYKPMSTIESNLTLTCRTQRGRDCLSRSVKAPAASLQTSW